MRISDWSSDVCSSDLLGLHDLLPAPVGCLHAGGQQAVVRALDGDDVLVARHAARLLEVLAFAIERQHLAAVIQVAFVDPHVDHHGADPGARSEEHTSELQSLMRISYAVFCLKKKNKHRRTTNH